MLAILLITVVNVIITVVNVQTIRASREATRILEKRRRDVSPPTSAGYGMPYPTTATSTPGTRSSTAAQDEAHHLVIRRLQLELSAAKGERDEARAELAVLKRARPIPPDTLRRALDDQRRCRDLLEQWDGYAGGYATNAVFDHCRDRLAAALQAEKVTVETFCQADHRTVRTYR